MVFQAGDWFLCAALSPAVFALARRYPLTRESLGRRLPLHFLFALGFCVAWAALGTIFGSFLHRHPFAWSPYGMGLFSWMLTTLPFGVAVYFAVLGVEHAILWFIEAEGRQTRAAKAEAQLADARLGALRMQLQPHFLLNSLNAITVIVRDRDTTTATRMLEQLGEMLRRVMRAGRRQEIPLADEIDFVRQYLAIEEMRFSDRLRPVFDIDPALLTAAVPEFVLQPLVENALRHGLAKREGATLLRIAARREGTDLALSVTDDGPGPAAPAPGAEAGVGLANIRERLATLYGDRARLDLVASPGGGTSAIVHLPWHEAERTSG